LCISVIAFAELHYGVERSRAPERNRQIVDDFTSRLEIRPWNQDAALHYAEIRSGLEAKGTSIGNMGLLIAAHARSGDCTLVSNNLREFRRVPRLQRENWAR
jgi:tRNA(fMet)-specific endonuclease VapC